MRADLTLSSTETALTVGGSRRGDPRLHSLAPHLLGPIPSPAVSVISRAFIAAIRPRSRRATPRPRPPLRRILWSRCVRVWRGGSRTTRCEVNPRILRRRRRMRGMFLPHWGIFGRGRVGTNFGLFVARGKERWRFLARKSWAR